MDTNYITLDLPWPHFRMVLIYHKPVIDLNNYIVKYDREKAYFPLLTMAKKNKAGYTATEVVCGWAGAIFGVTRLFGQEQ